MNANETSTTMCTTHDDDDTISASGSETSHQRATKCLEPYRYLLQVPGKNVRGRLIDAFQVWLSIPQEKVEAIKSIVKSLHTASLLVDDIEDNSKLRRGQPVAHKIYGVPSTLNCANYVYFLAMEKCIQLKSMDGLQVIVGELLNLHRGQGLDILWRDNMECPTEAQYVNMVVDKTGGLFRLSTKLMQCFSENKTDYTDLVNKMGLYFQVRDDLINLASKKYHENKSFCEDLTEGKFSFPIIHAIHSNPDDHRLLSILKQRTEDRDLKLCAVDWMRKMGSFKHTYDYLAKLKGEILEEIERLGGHERLVEIIHAFAAEVEECDL